MNIRWFRHRAGEQSGAVLAMVSVAVVAMIGATALAVDVGRVTNNNRTLQAKADVIAMDAGRALSGATAASLSGATGAVVTAVQNSATRNSVPFSQLTVGLGTLSGSTFTLIATPVLNGAIQTVTSTSVPTAVRVTASGTVNFAFQKGSKTTTRSATSTYSATAGFSIGSWLASIPAGGDGILNALLGDAFRLNAVSYTGLVNANVTLQQLGANIPVTALSPTQLLDTSVGIRDFMLASIAALSAQGNAAAVSVLNTMIASAPLTGTVQLGEFIDVVGGAETAAATASLNLLQLLTASAFVLEKSSGHALAIPTTSISIPGITSVTASLTVTEPPKIYFGPSGGPSIQTAQIRLSLTPVVNLPLGIPGLLNVGVYGSLPIDLSVAGATGTLSSINCAAPSITVGSTTQGVNLNSALTLRVRATVLFIPIDVATLTLNAGAKTTPNSYSTTFTSPAEFGPSNAKSVGSNTLGLDGLLNFSGANISILNGIINLGQIANAVVPAVNGLLGSLDDALVAPLTQVLGVKLAGADIAALGLNCSGLRLAG
ncbi:MAG TPA: hypothetical protein VEG38_14965 [Acidimicrobiia bacterium]|nr:hypothetical protein [Acidimicrobiia bacterium]